MKKNRLLLPAAFALAMTAANAQQVDPNCLPVLNNPNVPQEIRDELRAQLDSEQAERLLRQQLAADDADSIKTEAPDVKEQSCFDRFSNFRIVVGLGFPTMDGIVDMLMTQLRNQACRIADQAVNRVQSGINGQIGRVTQGVTNGANIPGVGNLSQLGQVNVGVNNGSTRVPGSQVSTGTDRIAVGVQDNTRQVVDNVGNRAGGTVGNRVGQAVGGLFR